VKLVMTLLVRDEADIVEACVRYHLEHCVDFVVVTDHGSVDRTSEILSEFERGGDVRVLRESAEIRQAEWTTRMARMAATEHGADWVVNVDADEFWLPRTAPCVRFSQPFRLGSGSCVRSSGTSRRVPRRPRRSTPAWSLAFRATPIRARSTMPR
jgi:Glycosyl transferase family 2